MLLLFTQTLLPLLRCPFVDFFGSLASRVFPSSLSLPSEGRDAFGRSRDARVCFPRVFLSFRSNWSSGGGGGGGVSGRAFGACELASVSSVHSWTVDTGVANSCFFFLSRLIHPPHLCTLDKVMGWESLRYVFSMFSVVSPASSLHIRRGGEPGETSECCSS